MKQTISLCDVCGSDHGVGRYRVGRDRSLLTADLCTEDAAPLNKILDALEKSRSTRARYRSGVVVSMGDVTAAKKAAEPTAKKPRKRP